MAYGFFFEKKATFAAGFEPIAAEIFPNADVTDCLSSEGRVVVAKIALYYNEEGKLVGFNDFKIRERDINGILSARVSLTTGFLPECQHNGETFLFGITEIAKYKLKHPHRPMFFIDNLLGPGAYAMVNKYIHTFYPTPGQWGDSTRLPLNVKYILKNMGDIAGVALADKNLSEKFCNFLVTTVPEGIKQDVYDPERAKNSENPAVQYFCESVLPGSNNSLLLIVPITFNNLFLSFCQYIQRRGEHSDVRTSGSQVSPRVSAPRQ